MADNSAYPDSAPAEEDWEGGEDRGRYTLGQPAEDAYEALQTGREAVCEMGRMMAELTIPSVMPPKGYLVGEELPGNNQSVGASCVNTLASKLMFVAFPPGQPIMKFNPVIEKLQDQIDQDPELYGEVLLSLAMLAQRHKERFEATGMASAYVELNKLLIIVGNGLWKQLNLDTPTVHKPDCYVVSRDRTGHPMVTIHHEKVRVSTLSKEDQEQILRNEPELVKKEDWTRECDIYSVCKLHVGHNSGDRSWLYWQEHKGHLLEGTEVETDYDDPPMWPCWLIPVYGQNWGRSYCEEYRGDLYAVEANASALNDGSAAAAWTLFFVKPGARTSLRQVQKAQNLSMLPGSAEDVTVSRTDKSADLNFSIKVFQMAMQRLGTAFLLQSAARRDGERVTAEEVSEVARELNEAMGGLYTSSAQGIQRRIIQRAVRLHEEENHYLPKVPEGVVTLQVVTGTDAMGQSTEAQNLLGFGKALAGIVGAEQAAQLLIVSGFATRLAAAMNVKPTGIVKDQKQLDAETQQAKQEALGQELASKAAGPVATALASQVGGQGQQQAAQ